MRGNPMFRYIRRLAPAAVLTATLVSLDAAAGSVTYAPISAARGSEFQQYVSLEPDTNRPGHDYSAVDLKEARPELCQSACARDGQCRAFTYVKPGIQGRFARCYLKKAVPNRASDKCCTSGVKR